MRQGNDNRHANIASGIYVFTMHNEKAAEASKATYDKALKSQKF